ncbi:helix-turn-helix domain-containing protein [Burkholderia gladioli]|uniref:Transcriptional regulator, AraC family n=1 Tax=Burkholderia gladioli (strain BSR3) TaxID=999541 RepID=F2LAG3_BURGS|nr:AraC family transcriptional regulator [Burkholderia gladioli]AEA61966.1 transcriptional regulator, AraC family [Burkholderia gladioli BSR3]MBW5282236.1 helix-turn-helix transcriptional regulator [Burkholderia gladioli]NHH81989.1 HTH-type transcriptional activator RhaS [Burkholderia gladioli]
MPNSARPDASRDRVRYGRLRSAGVELMQTHFEQHRFVAHAHDTWAVAAVQLGTKDISASARRPVIVAPGELYALPPQAAHAGRCIDGGASEYTMFYIPDAEWRARCAMHGVAPELLLTPRRHLGAAAQFADFAARLFTQPEAVASWDGEWSLFCERVLKALGAGQATAPQAAPGAPDVRLRRAADYLRSFHDRNVSLEQLAGEASLSVAELGRRFTAAYGLSPHRYQLVLRLVEAKRRLLAGEPLPEVAAATGFADQSHMGRHFKAMFGMTPGTLAARRRAGTF